MTRLGPVLRITDDARNLPDPAARMQRKSRSDVCLSSIARGNFTQLTLAVGSPTEISRIRFARNLLAAGNPIQEEPSERRPQHVTVISELDSPAEPIRVGDDDERQFPIGNLEQQG
jgi:hypothetical protein